MKTVVAVSAIGFFLTIIVALINLQVSVAQEGGPQEDDNRDPCFYDPDLPQCQPSTATPVPTNTPIPPRPCYFWFCPQPTSTPVPPT